MSAPSKFSKLHNHLVVILGGSSGIGFAVAEGSLEGGASVVIAGSSESKLSAALSRLQTSYPAAASESRIQGTTCNLSDQTTLEANLHALFKFATKDGAKKIDHIVNTAGDPGSLGPLKDTQATDVLKTGTVRYLANLMVGKIAPGYMTGGTSGSNDSGARTGGVSSITFTGGTMSLKPVKGRTTNLGWAGALEALRRGLAVELAPGIRVNMVAPGAIKTELLDKVGNPQMIEAFKEDTLVKDIGRPEDTAEAYLYLMKDRFITGQLIVTDGGRTYTGKF